MIQYNIYFGTIGETLGCKYRFTKWCRTDSDAIQVAKNAAASLYYKNEGKYGIPTYNQICEESKLTEVSVEKLYDEHINDMCRWYAIPSDLDSIPNKKIKY